MTHSYQQPDCSIKSCDELEELFLHQQSPDISKTIIATSCNLRKIHICGVQYNLHQKTTLVWTDIMQLVVNKCRMLEYIEVVNPRQFIESVLSGIKVGLAETQLLYREKFKIAVDIPGENDKKVVQRIIHHTPRIINLLEVSNIDDFMFVWCFNENADKYGFVNDIQDYLSTDIEIRIDGFRVVIMNKDCKINGMENAN